MGVHGCGEQQPIGRPKTQLAASAVHGCTWTVIGTKILALLDLSSTML
jgi:hypothetical protein